MTFTCTTCLKSVPTSSSLILSPFMIRPGVNVLSTVPFNIPILRSRVASVPAQRNRQIHLSHKSRATAMPPRAPPEPSSRRRVIMVDPPENLQSDMGKLDIKEDNKKDIKEESKKHSKKHSKVPKVESGQTDEYDIKRCNQYVTRILGQNPGFMTLQGTNSYLLHSPLNPEQPLFLIDTTSREHANEWVELVMARIEELYEEAKNQDKYRNSNNDPPMPYIQCIFLTHRHKDHTGGLVPLLAVLKERGMPAPMVYKMPNPDEAEVVLNDPETSDAALIDSLKGAHIRAAEGPIAPLAVPQTSKMIYQNALSHRISAVQLKAVHTPGHTADSMTYLACVNADLDIEPEDDNKWVAFVGDTVLGKGTGMFTDYEAYMDSLQRLAKLRPGWLFTGHGPDIRWESFAYEKIRTYIEHRRERHQAIKTLMKALWKQPKSLGRTIEATRKAAKAAGELWVAEEAKDKAILAAGGTVRWKPSIDAGTEASHLLAMKSEPIGDKFIGECEDVPAGITIPLLSTLIYKSNVPNIIRASSFSMRAHLLQLEKDGVVSRKPGLMPGLDEWKPTPPEEQEVWEWTAGDAMTL